MTAMPTNGHPPVDRARLELLRFATAGSVDDGKSTLIGRLLYDTKPIFADQLDARRADAASARGDGDARPRAADRRPARRARAGHHDRRRLPLLRHAAGASSSSPTRPATSSTRATWSPAPRPPTSRSCSSTRATGVRRAVAPPRVHRVAAAASRTSSCDQQDGPRRLRRGASSTRSSTEFDGLRRAARDRRRRRSSRSRRCTATTSSSAREHDALVRGPAAARPPRARRTSPSTATSIDVRFPVQWVIRPQDDDEHHDYRGYAGQVAGGVLQPGDEVVVLPSGARTRIAGDRHLRRPARGGVPADVGDAAPRGRPRRLARRPDLPRRRANPPTVARELEADVCWMADAPLRAGGRYALKHTTRTARAIVDGRATGIDVEHAAPRRQRRRARRSTRSAA